MAVLPGETVTGSRREAVERLAVGVIYLPIYYLILYPIVFFGGVILTALAIGWEIVTGRRADIKPRTSASAWESISQPVTWVFSGEQRDKPGWVP